MRVIGAILFATIGVMIGGCGLTGFRNRAKWLEFASSYKDGKRQSWVKWFAISLICLELASGLSMLTALVLLWLNLRVALVVGLWPAAVWLAIWILPKRKRKDVPADPISN